MFGALLIQVISGNHFDGIFQVGNLAVVTAYLESVAPPVLFTVRTPELRAINITVTLLAQENSTTNQEAVKNRLKSCLTATACPGIRYTEGSFRDAIVDGVQISFAVVKFDDKPTGEFLTTVLEYPVLGTVRFAVK